MKRLLSSLLFVWFLFSCDKEVLSDKNYHRINFDVSEWLLKGQNITCLDFDTEENAWIGSGSDLIFYDGRKTRTYDAGSEIIDISASPGGKVWLGTKDRGLACFADNKFVYFTMANAGLPRDLILAVGAAPDGSVWFSSSAHMLGGLMHFDGKRFELFTPENSPLTQNLVIDLKVDKHGNVFLSSEGTVTQAKVFSIDNRNNWRMLGGDSQFYWIASLGVTSRSEAVVATDHSLSSCAGCYQNEVFIFKSGKWEKIETGFEMGFFNRMIVDQNDYIWVQGSVKGDYNSYFVYDGRKWHRSAKGQIPEVFIKSVKADRHNNIWFCSTDGIFILKQP